MTEAEYLFLGRSASTFEPNEMFEPMDVDSECIEVHVAPEAMPEDNTTFDLMQIDSEDTKAGMSVKPGFGPGTFGKLPAGGVMSEHSQTRRNPVSEVSHRRSISQKIQGPFGTLTTPNFKRDSLIHHQKTGQPKWPGNGLGKMGKRKLARVASLSHRLVGHDPLNSFAKNYEKTMADWISLLGKATLPSDIASSDPRIITAFKAVDRVICGQEGTYLLRRLAYVQLMRLFTSLEAIIKSDRETGRVFREPCYRDASVAIDIYMSAQENLSHPDDLRRELKERKRAGRSWRDLARPSPLFVMIYSEAAEPIVRDFRRTDGATLKLAATRILEECPDQLVHICTRLADRAESAVRLNYSFDMRQIRESPELV